MSRLEYTLRRLRREQTVMGDACKVALALVMMFAVCLLLADGLIMNN